MKYLLWDFDNTLAYRDGMWSNTIFELLNENNIYNITMEDLKLYLKSGFPWHTPEISHEKYFGKKKWWEYMNEYFFKILKQLNIGDDVAFAVSNGIRAQYLNPSKWHVYNDTIKCLNHVIEKGFVNVILSNHVPELEQLVKDLGISNYFAKIYSSAHLGYEKPNRKIYEKVLIELIDVEGITMIGDSFVADIQGTKEAGIDAILVRNNNDYNYDKYFTSLNELVDYFNI